MWDNDRTFSQILIQPLKNKVSINSLRPSDTYMGK